MHPGDIIVANEDGAVVVLHEDSDAILRKRQEIDARELKMYFIKKHESLQKSIEELNRI